VISGPVLSGGKKGKKTDGCKLLEGNIEGGGESATCSQVGRKGKGGRNGWVDPVSALQEKEEKKGGLRQQRRPEVWKGRRVTTLWQSVRRGRDSGEAKA